MTGGMGWAATAAMIAVLAVSLGLAGSPGPAHAVPRLDVECRPSGLRVTASGTPLGTVLAEIGKCAGFSVTEISPDAEEPELSVLDLSLDELLERLLASKNYTVIYRDAESARRDARGAVVDRIVLLGPRAGAGGEEGRTPPPPGPAPGSATAGAVSAIEASDEAGAAFDPSTAGGEVATMLATHALSGVATQPAPGRSSSAAPTDAEGALAVMTQQAQQQVRALAEALETATRSLSQQAPASAP